MKNGNASERATALVNEAIEVLLRAERAPSSPVNTFSPAKKRRELRRAAKRLRGGTVEPRYSNLHTPEELADIFDRTVQRDEIFERELRELRRITDDLGHVLNEGGPEVGRTIETLIAAVKRAAKENGPGSEAAQRYRQLELLGWIGQQWHSLKRRQRSPGPRRISMPTDPAVDARIRLTAAERLPSPPSSGEPVIAIPPDGQDSGHDRLFLRIGLGDAAWTGSFERGEMGVSTISMMPDGKHLFVSADGAGYIIDLKSRTLVEQIGTDVVGVMWDEPITVFVVDHAGISLEAFGKNGRLWRTDPIGCAGFRGMAITNDSLVGEARQPSTRWVGVSVKLATGEVWFADGG